MVTELQSASLNTNERSNNNFACGWPLVVKFPRCISEHTLIYILLQMEQKKNQKKTTCEFMGKWSFK